MKAKICSILFFILCCFSTMGFSLGNVKRDEIVKHLAVIKKEGKRSSLQKNIGKKLIGKEFNKKYPGVFLTLMTSSQKHKNIQYNNDECIIRVSNEVYFTDVIRIQNLYNLSQNSKYDHFRIVTIPDDAEVYFDDGKFRSSKLCLKDQGKTTDEYSLRNDIVELLNTKLDTLSQNGRNSLSNIDFFNANLQRANFQNANLQHAILSNTRIQEAIFVGAKLQHAHLQSAILWDAQFRNANLQYAHLNKAQIHYANFKGAQLQNANFNSAQLDHANFQGANLEGVQFQNTDLQRAIFWNAQLKNANLWKAKLNGAYLQNANFQGANLWYANLQEAQMRNANFNGTVIEGINLINAHEFDLTGALDVYNVIFR